MYGIVYCTTNLLNGRKYIGKLVFGKNNSVNRHYLGSGTLLKGAIYKHGKSNFKRETLQECIDHSDLCESEMYWIDYFGATRSDLFYNLQDGGLGGMSDVRRESFKAHPNSIKALSEHKVKKHSAASRGKMSKAHSGMPMHPNTRAAIFAAIKKPVVQLSKSGEFIAQFPSVREASESFCFDKKKTHTTCTGISDAARGAARRKGAVGFKWMLLDDYLKMKNGR